MRHFAAILLASVLVAGAADRQKLRHPHIPEAATAANLVGDLGPTNIIHLSIGLPVRNEQALNDLLGDQYNPASTNYHRWLSSEEYTKRFGPTTNDYAAVEQWAKSKGLTISARHDGRTVLSVSGDVPKINSAFSVKMKEYRHPHRAKHFYAPDKEPTLDLATPVLGVSGFNNFPTVSSSITSPGGTSSGSGTGGNYIGYDFRRAYLPGVATNQMIGTGQGVGIVSFFSILTSDASLYRANTGLPSITWTGTNINIVSITTDPESILDFDMVYAMAPGCTPRLYQGDWNGGTPQFVDVLTAIADENICKQITCSYQWFDITYAGSAALIANSQVQFNKMATQGQTFFASAGDWDAYLLVSGRNADPYPAVCTNVVVVGGTELTMSGSGAAWSSESVWNTADQKGTGGGIGTGYQSIPAYQVGISMTANKGSAIKRNYPDIAMVADNIYIYYQGVGQAVAGTSASTPLWAALCALINEQAAFKSQPSVGFLNPAIYTLGKSIIYTNCFHDIITGNNYWSSSPASYPAVTNYDLCTGFGTPNGTNLINALFRGPTIVSLSFTNGLFINAK